MTWAPQEGGRRSSAPLGATHPRAPPRRRVLYRGQAGGATPVVCLRPPTPREPPPCALPACSRWRARRSPRPRCLRSPPGRPGHPRPPPAAPDRHCAPGRAPPQATSCACECRPAGSARTPWVGCRRAERGGQGRSPRGMGDGGLPRAQAVS